MNSNKPKLSNKKLNQKGFSLMEVILVVIIGGIIIGASVSIYMQVIKSHDRQESVMLVERSLQECNQGMERQILFAGQGIAVSLPEAFTLPTLPGVGNMPNPKTNKMEPIPLGVINPYKVGNYDAFTIFYSDPTLPRINISENTIADLETGSAKIALGTTASGTPVGGGGKGDNGDDGDGYKREVQSRFPTPTETPIDNGSNNSNNSFSTGLPSFPNAQMFKEGDLFLLVGNGIGSGQTKYNFISATKASSRLVRITSVGNVGVKQFGQAFLTVNYNLCLTGECGPQLPGLLNNELAPKSFGFGSILVPLRAMSFYVKETPSGKQLIKNVGGVILPNGNDSTNGTVRGGEEVVLGEIDNFQVAYNLKDGSVNSTPANLPVSWASDVQSLDVTLTRGALQKNGENLTQVVKTNFPLLLNNFN